MAAYIIEEGIEGVIILMLELGGGCAKIGVEVAEHPEGALSECLSTVFL
jgi:hypothetical protein